MRKYSTLKTLVAATLLACTSISANAELIGTGKPSSNKTASASVGCDWWNDGILACMAAWWD